ncbi:MAG: hypothetical protein ACT4OV_02720 [Microthrixaceae bacterium]
MPEGARHFFVHLQKTGGTALFQRLRHGFGPAAVYPLPDDPSGPTAVTDVDHLAKVYEANRPNLRVITGHFPLCTVDLLGEELTTFTLLRDPVERTLSLLRRRRMIDDRFEGQELEEIYDSGLLDDVIRNHMVKMLSMTRAEMTSVPLLARIAHDRAHLELAKHNLEHRIDVMGLQEDFEHFCGVLAARLTVDLGDPRHANRTSPQPVSDDLRRRIAHDNRLDVELYEFAVELAQRRRSAR